MEETAHNKPAAVVAIDSFVASQLRVYIGQADLLGSTHTLPGRLIQCEACATKLNGWPGV